MLGRHAERLVQTFTSLVGDDQVRSACVWVSVGTDATSYIVSAARAEKADGLRGRAEKLLVC